MGTGKLDYGDSFFPFSRHKVIGCPIITIIYYRLPVHFQPLQCSSEMGKLQHKMTLLCSDGNRVARRNSQNSHNIFTSNQFPTKLSRLTFLSLRTGAWGLSTYLGFLILRILSVKGIFPLRVLTRADSNKMFKNCGCLIANSSKQAPDQKIWY